MRMRSHDGNWPRCAWCNRQVYDTPLTLDYPLELGTNKEHRCAGLSEAIAAKRRGEVLSTRGLRFAPSGGE